MTTKLRFFLIILMVLSVVAGLSAGTGTSARGPALWISSVHADTVPSFEVNPTSLDFGTLFISSVLQETVLVSNNSAKALFISSVTVDSGDYVVTPASATVDPFGSWEFVVKFQPTFAGVQNGNVIFVHNGATSPDLLPLTGLGIAVDTLPSFLVTPSSIDFGAVFISSTSIETVLVSNNSANVLFISSVTVDSGEYVVSPASATVGAYGSSAFIVKFQPTFAGAQDGNVIFVHNGATSPDLLSLTGIGTPLTDAKDANPLPKKFALKGNYPNPFNPTTRIVFDIPQQTTVSLTVYNALGAEVAEILQNVAYQPGTHQVSFNGTNLASGVYFYRLKTPEFNSVKKMILLK